MAWIKVHEEIATHYKTERLADQLNLPPAQAAGHLLFLWLFTVRNAWKDGDLSKWGDKAIERGSGWQGEPGVLIAALRSTGWLDGSQIHDWHDVAGGYVKQRESNEKQHLKKKESIQPTVGPPVGPTVGPPVASPVEPPGEDKIRLDKIRLEESIKEQDALFAQFWEAYPRKDDKSNSRKTWNKYKVTPELLVLMLAKIKQEKVRWSQGEAKYIPMPSTWLNGKRWENEGVFLMSKADLDFNLAAKKFSDDQKVIAEQEAREKLSRPGRVS